jgi:PLP dependent protein
VTTDVGTNLAAVTAKIAEATRAAGRASGSTTLVAVSKQQPDDRIDAALAAGQRVFGENRVQEAQGRWTERRAAKPDLHLRLIGPLQSNKARDAVALFDAIDSVDRESLASALADAVQRVGRHPQFLVQINTGEEPQKAGVAPRDADAFLGRLDRTFGLRIAGVMCIPPVGEPAGPHFALLAAIARRNGLDVISMGMSEDFELAIRFGATHVRVGSGVFGTRLPR